MVVAATLVEVLALGGSEKLTVEENASVISEVVLIFEVVSGVSLSKIGVCDCVVSLTCLSLSDTDVTEEVVEDIGGSVLVDDIVLAFSDVCGLFVAWAVVVGLLGMGVVVGVVWCFVADVGTCGAVWLCLGVVVLGTCWVVGFNIFTVDLGGTVVTDAAGAGAGSVLIGPVATLAGVGSSASGHSQISKRVTANEQRVYNLLHVPEKIDCWAKQKKVYASTNMAQIFTGGRSGFFFCWNFLYTNPACQPQLFKSREQ